MVEEITAQSLGKKEEKSVDSFKYETTFSSIDIKYGLDSCVIVYLIAYPIIYKNKNAKIFDRKGIFYVHELSLRENMEIIKILIEKYDYTEKKAKEELADFLKKNNIQVVKTNHKKRTLALERAELAITRHINAHPPDSIIVSDFKEFGITRVFSEDGAFIDFAKSGTCLADRKQ